MPHICEAEQCDEIVANEHIMCRPHYALVPKSLRKRLVLEAKHPVQYEETLAKIVRIVAAAEAGYELEGVR